jgi:hypothetical protein
LRCRAAAAALPFIGWLLRCCPLSDFVIACRHATINALVASRFRRCKIKLHQTPPFTTKLLQFLWEHFGCKRLGFEGLFGRGPKTPFPHQILQCFSTQIFGVLIEYHSNLNHDTFAPPTYR